MKLDLIIAEIGSTTTLVNGFDKINTEKPVFAGQGLAPTTVEKGDVMIGLEAALADLKEKLGVAELDWTEFMATSSAAGGLKMTVHGLVKDMTVKAAEEAALGAGAVIRMITAGKIRDYQLDRIKDINPNIILLAGGVDYGEEEVILHNAHQLSSFDRHVPLIYAGNKVLQEEIRNIFKDWDREILITENVYPGIDELNVEPTRRLIQEVFARHIVRAPGMEKIKELLAIDMMPTPGAVMEASRLLKEQIGNLVTIDVGGATTDVHSVTLDSPAIREKLLNPEPEAKRTVEGDLGVFVNAPRVYEMFKEELMIDEIKELSPLPVSKEEAVYTGRLAEKAAQTALQRHAGKLKDYFGPTGRQTLAEGKDLTAVKSIIGTGGALTRLENGPVVLDKLKNNRDQRLLLPGKEARILIDRDYIMASAGVMSRKYPETALKLLLASLGITK